MEMRNRLLAALSHDELARLDAQLSPVSLETGTVLVRHGEEPTLVYFPWTASGR